MNRILKSVKQTYIHHWSFHSPENRNAISRALLLELHTNLIDLSQKSPKELPRVLILEGIPGLAFSAGADLKERAKMNLTEVEEFLNQLQDAFFILETLPIVTIAAISGVALGGGLELSLACDFRLAREDAKLGLPEVRLGIIPGAGGTQRLTRLVGISKAKEWILSGNIYSASEAWQSGIVHKFYPINEFENKVLEFASQFIESAPLSLKAAKSAIQEGLYLDLKTALEIERKHYNTTLSTHDRNEALQAFQEKRKPNFRGE